MLRSKYFTKSQNSVSFPSYHHNRYRGILAILAHLYNILDGMMNDIVPHFVHLFVNFASNPHSHDDLLPEIVSVGPVRVLCVKTLF